MLKSLTEKVHMQLFIADTLSRAYLPETQVDDNAGNEFCAQLEETNLVADLPISDERLNELWRATAADLVLQKARKNIEKGWSMSKQYPPPNVVPYYSLHSEISYQNVLLFKMETMQSFCHIFS
jgi:hypothetical protein